jgi:hypothetical protein
LKTIVGVKQESRHTAILILDYLGNDPGLANVMQHWGLGGPRCPFVESSKLKAECVKNPGPYDQLFTG